MAMLEYRLRVGLLRLKNARINLCKWGLCRKIPIFVCIEYSTLI